MNDPAINDILAYLVVLNHKPTLGKLTHEEFCTGSGNMMGCLHRVMDFFEKKDWREVIFLVKHRERLNGRHPVGHPELARATEAVSECLYQILRVQRTPVSKSKPLDPEQKKFMDALDVELNKILEGHNATAGN